MALTPAPLAHSARPNKGIAAQPYHEHIKNVTDGAVCRATDAARFSPASGSLVVAAARTSAEFHDLGKLDPKNQRILASSSTEKLDPRHEDAGVAHLLSNRVASHDGQLAAMLIYAHHRGLPSLPEESIRGENSLRDCLPLSDGRPLRDLVDERLASYLRIHEEAVHELMEIGPTLPSKGIGQVQCRIALSCLVDADHSDTARHYGEDHARTVPPLNAAKRLRRLDDFVANLAHGKTDERTRVRQEIYKQCRAVDPTVSSLWECDSPVGTGKTTAVMAHLLRAAESKKPGLRRLFVVLPFTNIIDQAVDVYRQSLVLPGEDPEDVVAAHHHKAEYGDPSTRHLAAMWRAPIVVTTAVQFFETLAARSTGGLRKLHELVGSGIFIDESHASLPAKLWPQAWQWIRKLATEWGCHFVLGSGSLNRIWTIPEITKASQELPKIVTPTVRTAAADAERKRVAAKTQNSPISMDGLVELIDDIEGPRLVIVNTVQIAAALADLLRVKKGPDAVMHLSTALTPHHRGITLERVKTRLAYRTGSNWTLVATSCVEAGVDLSFRNGLRQRASLTSLLQILGRVNRHGEFDSAAVWDFELVTGGLVNVNPGLVDAAQVLGELWVEGKIDPAYCTEALEREIRLGRRADLHKELREAEASYDFPKVEELFRVIDQKTVTAIVSRTLQEKLKKGSPVDWREIQRHSVQIYANRLEGLGVVDSPELPGVHLWTLPYDEFLGYMAGALPLVDDGTFNSFII